MDYLTEHEIGCPYCGERITVIVENSTDNQQYIEDCQVCCRPITISLSIAFDGSTSVRVSHENECD